MGVFLLPLFAQLLIQTLAFSPLSPESSLQSTIQKSKAESTFQNLDASRLHFQISIIDKDNFSARITSAIMARVIEYNDGLFQIFPSFATYHPENDPTAPKEAIGICKNLGLCNVKCVEEGVKFDWDMMDGYDLILCVDEEIQEKIWRSMPENGYGGYEGKVRHLAEFLNEGYSCYYHTRNYAEKIDSSKDASFVIKNMIESDLWEQCGQYYDVVSNAPSDVFHIDNLSTDLQEPRIILKDNTAVPNPNGWPKIESAMIIASAGVTRFCLDVINVQFEKALKELMNSFFYKKNHLRLSFEEADELLRKGNNSVTGYFSPQARLERIQLHMDGLKSRLKEEERDNNDVL